MPKPKLRVYEDRSCYVQLRNLLLWCRDPLRMENYFSSGSLK